MRLAGRHSKNVVTARGKCCLIFSVEINQQPQTMTNPQTRLSSDPGRNKYSNIVRPPNQKGQTIGATEQLDSKDCQPATKTCF